MDLLVKFTVPYVKWYGGWTILPPLIWLILYPIAHAASPWLIFKFYEAFMLGALGLSLNFMFRRMGFDKTDALLASLIATVYPGVFTLSWEFAMLMLGLVVMVLDLAIMYMHINSGKRHWIPLLLLTILSALAHQVSATLTALIYLTYFALKDRDARWVGLALIGITADLFYTNFTMLTISRVGASITVSSSLVTSLSLNPYYAIEGYLIQLIVNYWPLLILVSHGFRRGNFIIYALLGWLLVIILPSALMPSESFVLWWIWSLMLPIALAPLSTRPRWLAVLLIAAVALLDLAWQFSTIVNYIFPSIGPEPTFVQGTYARACVIPQEEAIMYQAGLYAARHLNETFVTDYCTYTLMHLADRYTPNVIPSYTPLETAIALSHRFNNTVYLVTSQYLANYTMVAKFGYVEILPYGIGTTYPIYIYAING